MVAENSSTQQMQEKVDKLKTLNLVSNFHNLTPPKNDNLDSSREISLVTALKVAPRIREIFLEIRGLELDEQGKEYLQVTRPIMNFEGAYRFVKILKNIAQETEWASFSEDEITRRIIHYFEVNYPNFTFYCDQYELNESDFNYIESTLQSFIDSSFHKAKSGKYINTLGRTYDEGVLKKALETSGDQRQNNSRRENGLSKMNPLKIDHGND